MTLPVSSYEELLARVRSLTSETIQLRREITSSLCDPPALGTTSLTSNINYDRHVKTPSAVMQERTSVDEDLGKGFNYLNQDGSENKNMFDEKEIEELYDEFLNLDGKMFLESEDDVITNDVNISFIKNLPDIQNNNNNNCNNKVIERTSGFNVNNTIDLDLLNENFISLRDENLENTMITSDLKEGTGGKTVKTSPLLDKKEDEVDNEFKEIDEKLTSPDSSIEKNLFQRNGWAPDTLGLWHSGPSSLNLDQSSNNYAPHQNLTASCNSYESQYHSLSSSSKRTYSHHHLGAKVEMVYSLLSMLDMDNREDMSKTFLAMSSSPESCHAMRQSGCLPLLIQLIHSSELDKEVRKRAAEALFNIVHAQTDEKRRRREVRVLKLLQQVREYCDELKTTELLEMSHLQESESHPINAIGTLMKFSFDAEHRQAICTLGGLHAITELIQVDHEVHGSTNDDTLCITLRRYAGMSLTNLTFGDGKNKSLLCSFNRFMHALVDQLKSPSEDLRQVTASVLRNLSWRADSESKQSLRKVGAVTALTVSAMEGKKESTLKSILSALWNLSAHCSLNKIDICSVPGALAFLVKMLRYKSLSNTLAIIENAGGILRNISSHIAVREDYRQILRDNNCFEVLLEQLKSPSLTIVSNACGTLWNLSARCQEDQRRLWEMGATSMLRSLVQSKHKMISMGSSAALKNLLAANPNENLLIHLDSTAKSLGLQNLPTLFVRKKRALEQELSITLAETCENIDPVGSPIHLNPPQDKKIEEKKVNGPRRSDSRDSVQSTQSDSTYERLTQIAHKNEEKLFENRNVTLHDSLDEKSVSRKIEDQKLMRRYKASMIPTPTFKKMNQDRLNEKTREETVVENNVVETVIETNSKPRGTLDSKEKTKKRIPVLNTRLKNNLFRGHESSDENCSSLNNWSNGRGSLKGEPFEERVVKNYSQDLNSALNSQVGEEFLASNLNCEGNKTSKTSCHLQSNEVSEKQEVRKSRDNNKKESEDLGNLGVCTLNIDSLTAIVDEIKTSDDDSLKNSNKNISEKAYKTESGHDEILNERTLNFLKYQHEIPQSVVNDNYFDNNHLTPAVAKIPEIRFQEHNALTQLQKARPLLKNSNSRSFGQNVSNERFEFSDARKDILVQEKQEVNESGQIMALMDNCGSLFQRTKPKEETDVSENLRFDTRAFIQETRNKGETDEKLQVLFAKSASLSQQSCPKTEFKLKNSVDNPYHLAQVDTERRNSISYSSTGGFEDRNQNQNENVIEDSAALLKSKRTEIILTFPAQGFSDLALNAEDDLENRGNIYPKFKVGSPITDSRVLQMEANKICREIRKHQDIDMGCSLTSDKSLISCSSFLDTGDYSLFESSTDAVDFDESENSFLSRGSSYRIKNFRKPHTAETVSLPSLGSVKTDQLEAIDLDNSVLSVASITSEIAETCSKEAENINTYTKTYRADAQNDFIDDTAADVTLVSNGDDTLNADSLQHNSDLFDEENSLHCQENLPFESETLQETTSDRVNKKLTPKEKRKTFHERYRTYTIRDIEGCKNFKNNSTSGGQVPKADLVECSATDIHHINCDKYNLSSGNEYEGEKANVDKHYFFRKHETFHFSKSLDKERDLIPDFVSDSKSLNDLLSIGPAERQELVDNAILVAFSLKTAVQEPENSDSEMEGPHKSLDIDTATYSKNIRHQDCGDLSSQEVQNWGYYSEEVAEEELEKKGARILKPDDKSEERLEEITKVIRGKRKPLYSSSQKNLQKTYYSPLSSPKISQAVVESKSEKIPVLHREGTFTKEDGPDLKKFETKNAKAIKNSNSSRAGIRTKSGLPVGNTKRLGENQTSRIGRPVSTYGSKNGERRAESDSSHRRPYSAGVANKNGGDCATVVKRPTSTSFASPKIRNSSSNQNIRAGNSPGSSSAKSNNSSLQSSKSQSDASLNLVAKDKVSAGKQKTPKKEVTSKIASLWRKVEESKQKVKNVKDNRVWIGPEKCMRNSDEILIIEQEEIVDIPTRKIVHSYTCQALGDEISHFHSRARDSRNYVGSSEDGRGKTERRNIISAVVPPYNYNPPVSAQVAPSKIKQVDTFSKGSLKVTTV